MNTAPIFSLCASNPAVTALLGATPNMKLYMFGMAPQGVQAPYAVWQVISGQPEIYLSGRPDVEVHGIQIDVYAKTANESRKILNEIEKTIELDCYIVRYNGDSFETETKLFRSSLDVDWHTYR